MSSETIVVEEAPPEATVAVADDGHDDEPAAVPATRWVDLEFLVGSAQRRK